MISQILVLCTFFLVAPASAQDNSDKEAEEFIAAFTLETVVEKSINEGAEGLYYTGYLDAAIHSGQFTIARDSGLNYCPPGNLAVNHATVWSSFDRFAAANSKSATQMHTMHSIVTWLLWMFPC